MRTINIILMMIALVVIVGCGQSPVVVEPGQQQTMQQPAQQQIPQQSSQAQQPQPQGQVQTTTAPGSSSVITPVEYDKKVKALMDNAGKVKSYAFYYTDKDTQLESDHYYVKGNKVVIRLYDVNEWNNQYWVDSIYMDTATKSAIGFCERREAQRCADHEKQYRVDYSYFMKKFPLDWMSEIPSSAKVVSSDTVDDRWTDVVEYTDAQGNDVRLSMDRTYGVPLRVTINGKQAYYYRDTAFNAVKDADLAHQT